MEEKVWVQWWPCKLLAEFASVGMVLSLLVSSFNVLGLHSQLVTTPGGDGLCLFTNTPQLAIRIFTTI